MFYCNASWSLKPQTKLLNLTSREWEHVVYELVALTQPVGTLSFSWHSKEKVSLLHSDENSCSLCKSAYMWDTWWTWGFQFFSLESLWIKENQLNNNTVASNFSAFSTSLWIYGRRTGKMRTAKQDAKRESKEMNTDRDEIQLAYVCVCVCVAVCVRVCL